MLFLREGMAGWIMAWAALRGPECELRTASETVALPEDLRSEVARIAVEMALGIEKELMDGKRHDTEGDASSPEAKRVPLRSAVHAEASC
jgi:hypothetical protein